MTLLDDVRRLGSDFILDSVHLLYPPVCSLCGIELAKKLSTRVIFTCDTCMASIEVLEAPWCVQCGDPMDSLDVDLCSQCAHEAMGFDLCRSYGLYDGALARLIQLLKYERERALARDLVPLLQSILVKERLTGSFDAITFVPMRSKRQRQRGFNQS